MSFDVFAKKQRFWLLKPETKKKQKALTKTTAEKLKNKVNSKKGMCKT